MPLSTLNEKESELLHLEALREKLAAIKYAGYGQVEALFTSPEHGHHVPMKEVRVIPQIGVEGDRPYKQYWKGKKIPGRQISVMNAEVLDATEIAYDVPGDNLIIRGIDLSRIDEGDAIRVGDAVLIATGARHRPCKLFVERTSTAHYAAISQGSHRGTMFDAIDRASIRVGDPVERLFYK